MNPMIPQGLTCASCRQPFRGRYARRGEAGWVHADARACASPDTLTHGRWIRNGLTLRWEPDPAAEPIARAVVEPESPGTTRSRRHDRSVPEMLDDAEWLADHDANLTEALHRLNISRTLFHQNCRRYDRMALYWRLLSREPESRSTRNAFSHRRDAGAA